MKQKSPFPVNIEFHCLNYPFLKLFFSYKILFIHNTCYINKLDSSLLLSLNMICTDFKANQFIASRYILLADSLEITNL